MAVQWREDEDTDSAKVDASSETDLWQIANRAGGYYRHEISIEPPLETVNPYIWHLNSAHSLDLMPESRPSASWGNVLAAFSRVITQTVAEVQRLQRLSAATTALSGVEAAIERSRAILDLEDDWDDAGAVPISPSTWHRATGFLRDGALRWCERCQLHIEEPTISPVADGSIDLHWRNDQRQLLINVPEDANAPIEFYGDDRGRTTVKGTIDASDSTIWLFEWLMK